MTFSATDFGYHLFLEPGDDLVRSLIQFAREQEVDSAILSGFGSVTEVELGTGNGRHREHRRRHVIEPLEVCSLTGTLTLVDGEPFPHLHGTFARSDCDVIGGHVYEAICATHIQLNVQVTAGVPAGPFIRSVIGNRTAP